MMLRLVYLLAITVILCHADPIPTRRSGMRPADEAPEDKFVPWMLEYFGRHPETLLDALSRLPPDMRAELPHDLDHIIPKSHPRKSEQCQGCEQTMILFNLIEDLPFVDYWVIRDVVLTVCEALMNSTGVNGDIWCPPVCDNHGPLTFDIIEKNTKPPFEACYFLNHCGPDDVATDPEIQISETNEELKQMITENKPDPKKTRSRPKRSMTSGTPLKVAQLTDIHVDEDYLVGSAIDCGLPICCHKEYSGSGSAGEFGDFKCNVPPSTTEMFLKKTAELEPDIILYTGDSPPHHLWEETYEGMMNVTLWVGQKLQQYFPGRPAYASIGNHENFPSNIFYSSRTETQGLLNTFINAFGNQAGFDDIDEEMVMKGGYYSKLIKPGLRLLNVNSNFGYPDNFYALLLWDEVEVVDMMQYTEYILAQARINNEKVIFITHHPVGVNIINYDSWITRVCLEYGDTIVLHVAGHTHKEEWRLFIDNATSQARSVQFVSQSANTYSDVNPGIRIYYLDSTTFELLDFDQYYLDINSEDPGIKLSYKMREEYGLDEITAPSMLHLVHRMEKDDELFQRYWVNRRTQSGVDGTCAGECKHRALCNLLSSTIDMRRQCYKETAP